MKCKHIYYVYLINKHGGLGLQPVKANNKVNAKKKFKKRFPKSRIIDIQKGIDAPFILQQQAI